jgi:hypothetical protein
VGGGCEGRGPDQIMPFACRPLSDHATLALPGFSGIVAREFEWRGYTACAVRASGFRIMFQVLSSQQSNHNNTTSTF